MGDISGTTGGTPGGQSASEPPVGQGSVLHRGARRDPHAALPLSAIEDTRLSWRARGLLVWILSRPDGARVNSNDLAGMATEGREAVRTALRELVDTGYIVREKVRGDDGRLVTRTLVYDTPSTGDGFSGAGSPGTGYRAPVDRAPVSRAPSRAQASSGGSSSRARAGGDAAGHAEPPPPRTASGRPRDLVFEAVAEVCGIDWHDLTASARGPLTKAVKELKEVGADADEVRRRATIYRRRFGRDITLTPTALCKWWPTLEGESADPESSTYVNPSMQNRY